MLCKRSPRWKRIKETVRVRGFGKNSLVIVLVSVLILYSETRTKSICIIIRTASCPFNPIRSHRLVFFFISSTFRQLPPQLSFTLGVFISSPAQPHLRAGTNSDGISRPPSKRKKKKTEEKKKITLRRN
jgi:hypothetical protein